MPARRHRLFQARSCVAELILRLLVLPQESGGHPEQTQDPEIVAPRRAKKDGRSSSESRYDDTAERAARADSCYRSSWCGERLALGARSPATANSPPVTGSSTVSTFSPQGTIFRFTSNRMGGGFVTVQVR